MFLYKYMNKKEYYKQYYIDNKDRTAEARKKSNKAWYLANRDAISERRKIYVKSNKERIRLHQAEYRKNNKELMKKQRREQYLKHKDKYLAHEMEYRNNNKKKQRIYAKQYREDNRKILNDKLRERYRNDVEYRIKKNLRKRISDALHDHSKSKTTIELLDCSVKELKKWLESQFEEGMTWNNYGEWHLDHVYPCSLFDLTQPYEQEICFNWFNLQPMWGVDNLSKGAKINVL